MKVPMRCKVGKQNIKKHTYVTLSISNCLRPFDPKKGDLFNFGYAAEDLKMRTYAVENPPGQWRPEK